jgi:outer membrane protein assembly factor BamB
LHLYGLGARVWSAAIQIANDTMQATVTSPSAIVNHVTGDVYIVSNENAYAFTSNGKQKWHIEFEHPSKWVTYLRNPSISNDGKIVVFIWSSWFPGQVSTELQRVTAVNAITGTQIWTTRTIGQSRDPIIFRDHSINNGIDVIAYVTGSEDQSRVKLSNVGVYDIRTGQVLWQVNGTRDINYLAAPFSSISYHPYLGHLYVPALGLLTAFDVANGGIAWATESTRCDYCGQGIALATAASTIYTFDHAHSVQLIGMNMHALSFSLYSHTSICLTSMAIHHGLLYLHCVNRSHDRHHCVE